MIILNFGKFKSHVLEDIYMFNKPYFQWLFYNKREYLVEKQNEVYHYLSDKFKDNDYYMIFGKYKNLSLKEIQKRDNNYIEWLNNQDLSKFINLKSKLLEL